MNPLNLQPFVRVASLILLCGFVLCGCAKVASPGSTNLSEVKKFDPYPVYYAGENVDGLPFTGISEGHAGKWIYWGFGYGVCDPPSGLFEEGGCSLPLSIQNWSTCYRWPRRKFHLFDFRGAKATGGGPNGSQMEIFTGRTTVVVFAHDQSVTKFAARRLRTVRQAQPTLLPPPVPGSLRGKLPCQRRPG